MIFDARRSCPVIESNFGENYAERTVERDPQNLTF